MKEFTEEDLAQYNGRNGKPHTWRMRERYLTYQRVFFGRMGFTRFYAVQAWI